MKKQWQSVPNVGPAVAEDLMRLGFDDLTDLRGESAQKLYDRMAEMDGRAHDICLLDVFEAVISIANGHPPQPWWVFSRRRLAATRTGDDHRKHQNR